MQLTTTEDEYVLLKSGVLLSSSATQDSWVMALGRNMQIKNVFVTDETAVSDKTCDPDLLLFKCEPCLKRSAY